MLTFCISLSSVFFGMISIVSLFTCFFVSLFTCLSMVSIAYQCHIPCHINALSSAVYQAVSVAMSILIWHNDITVALNWFFDSQIISINHQSTKSFKADKYVLRFPIHRTSQLYAVGNQNSFFQPYLLFCSIASI